MPLFEKGKSGNASGRSKVDREFRALCREKSERCLTRLMEWVESDRPAASVMAAKAVIEHGHGKAPVNVNELAELRDMLSSMPDEKLRARAAEILARQQAEHAEKLQ